MVSLPCRSTSFTPISHQMSQLSESATLRQKVQCVLHDNLGTGTIFASSDIMSFEPRHWMGFGMMAVAVAHTVALVPQHINMNCALAVSLLQGLAWCLPFNCQLPNKCHRDCGSASGLFHVCHHLASTVETMTTFKFLTKATQLFICKS